MCKKITAIHVDSNDMIAGSNSSSDFKITLNPPVALQNSAGISVKTMILPYTLRTINTNVNDKLYVKVGALRKKITLTEDTYEYNSSSITRFINDLNAKLATAFPQAPTLHNIAGSTWTKYAPGLPTDGSTVTLTQVSTYVFNYVVSSTTYTITFTAFDMNNGSAQFTESDGGSLSGVRTFNLATGRFEGSTIPHDWIPPSNFYWQGIYPVPGSSPVPAVVCSQVNRPNLRL